MKQCYICKEFKELTEFSKDKGRKDGLQLSCKQCFADYRLKNRGRILAQKAEARANRTEEEKRETAEYMAEYQVNRYEEKREEILAQSSEYRRTHKKETAAQKLAWRKANPGKYAAYCAKRRAKKLQATPKWLTEDHWDQINETYELDHSLQWLSNEPLEVDHIIPLQGENVSGLHVPWNLQILPKSTNMIKGNKVLEEDLESHKKFVLSIK